MRRLRIVLVDDHEIVRLGLRVLIESRPYLTVVAEASTAAEAVAVTRQHRPDVVLMDVRLDGSSGIDATRTITTTMAGVEVIMLTSVASDQLLRESLAAGAHGFVLKQLGGDELLTTLTRLQEGLPLDPPTAVQQTLGEVRAGERAAVDDALATLSEQELRILALIASGLTNREIARRLELSDGTVRNYSSALLRKLGLSTRAAAAAFAAHHHVWEYVAD